MIIQFTPAHVANNDNLLISLSVVGMLVALRFAKKDPGIIPQQKLQQYQYDSYAPFGIYTDKVEPHDQDLDEYEVVNMDDIHGSKEIGN